MALASAVANPRVTIDIVTRDQTLGLEENRALLFVQKTSAGTASVGLNVEVPRTNAEINALFGPTSMGAFLARQFRRVNAYTPLDAVVLADNGSGTAATGSLAFTGTATAAGRIRTVVASAQEAEVFVDVAIGDTAAVVAGAIKAALDLITVKPFTSGLSTATLTFTAANKGTHANSWPLICQGVPAGLSCTLTGWASGATDPSLTGVFDYVANLRHQHIVWPSTWPRTALKTWIDARKNVENDIKEGRVFIYDPAADLATSLTNASTVNSSEIVLITNKVMADADWAGPHLPEAPDLVATYFAGARALRFETGISISNIVATNESKDQFGGIHTASLPYFNTPLVGFGLPKRGAGYLDSEQVELMNGGVTVVGANRSYTGIVMGQVATTWLDDAAGNPDDTWKWLEWRDTHGVCREVIVNNVRKKFSQYRLTTGDAPANYAIANEAMIRGYILDLCQTLQNAALIVSGQAARQFIQDNMVVTIVPEQRQAQVYIKIPIVSQLADIIGTIKFTFSSN